MSLLSLPAFIVQPGKGPNPQPQFPHLSDEEGVTSAPLGWEFSRGQPWEGCAPDPRVSGTLTVSGLTWLWVSLRREMELWLRPPTTAISVLKFCSCRSSWGINGEKGDSESLSGPRIWPSFSGEDLAVG